MWPELCGGPTFGNRASPHDSPNPRSGPAAGQVTAGFPDPSSFLQVPDEYMIEPAPRVRPVRPSSRASASTGPVKQSMSPQKGSGGRAGPSCGPAGIVSRTPATRRCRGEPSCTRSAPGLAKDSVTYVPDRWGKHFGSDELPGSPEPGFPHIRSPGDSSVLFLDFTAAPRHRRVSATHAPPLPAARRTVKAADRPAFRAHPGARVRDLRSHKVNTSDKRTSTGPPPAIQQA